MLWPAFLWFIEIWDVFNVGSQDYQWDWESTDKSSRRRGLFNGKCCALKLFDTKFSSSHCHWDGLFYHNINKITFSRRKSKKKKKKLDRFISLRVLMKITEFNIEHSTIFFFSSEKWTHIWFIHTKFFDSFFFGAGSQSSIV